MTVKQGEDINKQFTTLKDSIVKLNYAVEQSKADLESTSTKNKVLSEGIVNIRVVVDSNISRVKYLEKELILAKKDLIQDKKFIRRQTTTLAGILSSFIVAMYFFVK